MTQDAFIGVISSNKVYEIPEDAKREMINASKESLEVPVDAKKGDKKKVNESAE